MQRVRSVSTEGTWETSIRYVSGSTSTKTGTAPTVLIASTVGAAGFDTVTTSSPGPMPSALSATTIAFVPLSTATQCGTRWYSANARSNRPVCGPHTSWPDVNTVSTASRMSARSSAYSFRYPQTYMVMIFPNLPG